LRQAISAESKNVNGVRQTHNAIAMPAFDAAPFIGLTGCNLLPGRRQAFAVFANSAGNS
jgi:hypothetical protein